eukprot:g10407.t1
MWLGWDHCGYDTIDDEPQDPENSMAWQPPPSGRGERAHLLSPVGLPRDVLEGENLHRRRQQKQQQQRSHRRRVSVNTNEGGETHLDLENDDPLSSADIFDEFAGGGGGTDLGGRRLSGSGSGGGAGGAISSFFRGGSKVVHNNNKSRKRAGVVTRRARFLSEDSAAGNTRRHQQHHQHRHLFEAAAAASSSSFLPGDERGGGAQRRSSLWQAWRWGGGTGSYDGALDRQTSDDSQGSNGSFGLGGGGVGGGGGNGGNGGKIPEMFRVAFFDPDYDTSRQHLVKLFNALDTNGSGTITYEAMRMGLANLGTYSDVNYLMRRAEMDKTKEISLDGFVEIVQDYAEKMFAAKQAVPVSCFCYDYSPEAVAFRWVRTGDPNPPSPSVSLRELMSERGDQTGNVRWVCVTGSNPSLVIHMANRFGIHPLQVEDCLNPRERLKVDAFRAAPVKPPTDGATAATTKASAEGRPSVATGDSNEMPTTTAPGESTSTAAATKKTTSATLFPTVSPASTPPAAAETSQAQTEAAAAMAANAKPRQDAEAGASPPSSNGGPSPAAVHGGDDAILRSTTASDGAPGSPPSKSPPPPAAAITAATSLTTASAAQGVASAPEPAEEILHVLLGRISLRNPTLGRPSNFEREQVSIFLVGDHTVLFIEPTASGVSDQISNRIYYAGSKLRLNNARYLVYSLMDSIVDDVFPIMQHFQAWLVQLQEQLHSEDSGPSLDIVRAIQQISRDMHMITFYLRPMKVVATQLITDLPGNDADLKRHLEDLRDHLLMLEEQALRMSTWSRSLNKDWVNEQQHRMNQVVYILTMVTSAFMPAQFLTGVFGMNFKFMPELNWRYSYASFWVLVALLAFSSYTVYKRHKWL